MKKTLLLFTCAFFVMSACTTKDSQGVTGIPFQESEKGLWGMLSTDGTVIFSDEFKNQPTVIKEGLFMVKNNDNLWEIYKTGEKPQKIGGEYVYASLFEDGHALVCERNKHVTIIDTDGKTVKTIDKIDNKEVGAVCAFSEGYAIYKAGEYAGVIDKDGKPIIPAQYCAINNCSDGKFITVDKKYEKELKADSISAIKYTVLDNKGKKLFDISGAKYCQIGNFNDGLLPVCVEKDGDRVWGIINESQEVIVKPSQKIKEIGKINNGLFTYYNGDGWGLMNIEGATLIRAKYDMLAFDAGGLLLAGTKTDDGKVTFKFIDKNDNQIGEDTYISSSTFQMTDGEHALVQISDKQWSLIGRDGQQLKNLPDMVNISYNTGDYIIESDYVDIKTLIDRLNITQDGIDGIKFGAGPKDVVDKLVKYTYYGDKQHAATSPYWYNYQSEFDYTREINNIYPEMKIAFSGEMSRQTYRTKRVIDYTYGDWYWYHNEKIPTGYAWNNVNITSFNVKFDNSGKLLGKLHNIFNELSKRFKNMGTVNKENNGAIVVTLKNNKVGFVYMTAKEVHVVWGNIGSAASINIDKYKNMKENLGTEEPAVNGINWDFKSSGASTYGDIIEEDIVDSCAIDTVG